MNAVHIRSAHPGDAAEMARVQLASWLETYPGIVPRSYLEAMTHEEYKSFWSRTISEEPDGRVFYVAEDEEGEIVGFASGGPGREPPRDGLEGELYTIYLAPGRGGDGIGTKLVGAVASGLRDNSCQSLYCWVMAKNGDARGFYERLGGTECGENTFTVHGAEIVEIAYEWIDLTALTERG